MGCDPRGLLILAQTVSPIISTFMTAATPLAGNAIPNGDWQKLQTLNTNFQKDMDEITKLVNQYNSDKDKAKLDRIAALLDNVESNLDRILPTLQVSNPAAKTKITTTITLALAGVRGLLASVPRSTPPTRGLPQTPSSAQKDAEKLKKQFNSAMAASTGDAQVDRALSSAKLQ
jgi:hypothetical protein